MKTKLGILAYSLLFAATLGYSPRYSSIDALCYETDALLKLSESDNSKMVLLPSDLIAAVKNLVGSK